ncbi:hypothetical protein MMC24_007213 [Lignoscripta atroalba]|nr:hypothetical protein [Lignoscripta atroalba]
MAFEEELLQGGRGPHKSRHGVDMYWSRPSYNVSHQQGRRRPDHHRINNGMNRRTSDDRNGRFNTSRRPPKPSFQDAVADLYEMLYVSLEHYSGFKKDFEHEVRGITAYAGSRVLGELWVRKVAYTDRHRDSHDTRDVNDQHAESSSHASFKSTYHDLLECFEIAIGAPPSRKSRRPGHDGGAFDKGSFDRLVTKLMSAADEVSKLGSSVTKRCSDAQSLITELETVVAILDKSRDLWNPRAAEEVDRHQDFDEREGHDGFNPEVAEDQDPYEE